MDFEKKNKLACETGSIPLSLLLQGPHWRSQKIPTYELVFFRDFTSICCLLVSYFYPLVYETRNVLPIYLRIYVLLTLTKNFDATYVRGTERRYRNLQIQVYTIKRWLKKKTHSHSIQKIEVTNTSSTSLMFCLSLRVFSPICILPVT